MILIIDNYDSFTYNLVHYFEMEDYEVVVRRNDEISIEQIIHLNPRAIVISPGPCTPLETGICLSVLDKLKGLFPILGICLGHQTIAHYFGAQIVRCPEPVHGKVFLIEHDSKGIFMDLPTPIKVTRYHSLQVDASSLPSCLSITATTQDGTIMGIRHKEYAIEGVQFHPEAILTQYGHQMLRNFMKLIK